MGLIDQMMASIYKPPKQEKLNTVLPKNLTPAKAANLINRTNVTEGQLLKGQVLDLRTNQILVLLENGATVSARTDGTLNLSIGENANFFVAGTSEDQILLKLAKDDTPAENPMIDKALTAAGIQKTERSVSIVTELLSHQQPVNEGSIRHYLSLSAKYPELPVKDLVLMELHHIPVTAEHAEQFTKYHSQTAKLVNQAQDMVQSLTKDLEQLPEGPIKQEILQELKELAAPKTAPSDVSFGDTSSETTTPTDTVLGNAAISVTTPEAAVLPETESLKLPATDTGLTADIQEEAGPVLKNLLDSFFLTPEEAANPDKLKKYYDELKEKLTKLELLTQKLAQHTNETVTADAPKQMRQNLSFLEAVNHVFPYIQLPLKFRETPTHGELYVYEKKKSLRPSDTLSALLHLELEALGTTDIYVTLTGNHVTTRFSVTDKDSGNLIKKEMPKLTEALTAKGYTLQSEVSLREPEEANTPTLLEQFLEEHAPGSLNRYTFDIRA